jgi:protein-tyrosine phosphatase
MKKIDNVPLWLGHAGDGRDYRQLLATGIRAVVQLALEEPPLSPPRELLCLRIPLVDGEGNEPAILQLAIRTVASLLQARLPTLVCCGGGMSRSPAVAAAALALVADSDASACLQKIEQSGPMDVSPALWREIRAICESLDRR